MTAVLLGLKGGKPSSPEHVPVSAIVELTSATLPVVADIAILPVASGAGKFAPEAPPDAS
jgi:hypothetical protein